jgi:hypothetical protein
MVYDCSFQERPDRTAREVDALDDRSINLSVKELKMSLAEGQLGIAARTERLMVLDMVHVLYARGRRGMFEDKEGSIS